MQIGNDNFAWLGTTQSKSSRLNFLDLPHANYTERGQRSGAALHARVRARRPSIARPATSSAPSPRQGDPLWMAIGIA